MRLRRQLPIWFWLGCGFIVLFLLVWWYLESFFSDSTSPLNSNVAPPSATASTTADKLPANVKDSIVEGSRFHNGDGTPQSSLGKDGDYYIRRENGIIYEKVWGKWQIVYVPPTSSSDDETDYLAIYEAND